MHKHTYSHDKNLKDLVENRRLSATVNFYISNRRKITRPLHVYRNVNRHRITQLTPFDIMGNFKESIMNEIKDSTRQIKILS